MAPEVFKILNSDTDVKLQDYFLDMKRSINLALHRWIDRIVNVEYIFQNKIRKKIIFSKNNPFKQQIFLFFYSRIQF